MTAIQKDKIFGSHKNMKTSILPLHLSTKRSSRISKSSLSLLWRSVIKIGFAEE